LELFSHLAAADLRSIQTILSSNPFETVRKITLALTLPLLDEPILTSIFFYFRPSTDSTSNQKRRRREMHAITAIVETKEFPYNDDYLWRNNGNTTHKKSGNKSIYYKCAKQVKVQHTLNNIN
jgi:hypothetical protein